MMTKSFFIDGGYLSHRIPSHKRCDFASLIQGYRETRYFSALPYDVGHRRKAQKFFSYLGSIGVKVRLGSLLPRGGIFVQKGVDILLALDMVEACNDPTIKEIHLLAGDGDFCPLIKMAKGAGKTVVLHHGPRETVSGMLIRLADKTVEMDSHWESTYLR